MVACVLCFFIWYPEVHHVCKILIVLNYWRKVVSTLECSILLAYSSKNLT